MVRKPNYKNKICEICGKEYKPTNSKQKYCIECKKNAKYEYDKKWKKDNKELIKQRRIEYQKKYYQKNKEKIKEKNKKYYQENREYKKEYQKKYREDNKEKIIKHHKEYYIKNKNDINKKNKQWYQNNIEHCKEYDKQRSKDLKRKEYKKISNKKYYQKNKEEIKEKVKQYRQTKEYRNNRKEYRQQRYHNDISYKLTEWCRQQVRRCLYSKKNKYTFNILDYTPEQLKQRLEMNFKPDMNWENHGILWHIDHIKPLCKFNFIDENGEVDYHQVFLANCLANLQPLYVEENLSKGGK